MQELIIEQVDGNTIKRRYVDWKTFKKDELEKLRIITATALADIDFLLGKFV